MKTDLADLIEHGWDEDDLADVLHDLTGLDYDDLAGFFRRCEGVAEQWESLEPKQHELEWLILKLNEAIRLMEPGDERKAAIKVCLEELWNPTVD